MTAAKEATSVSPYLQDTFIEVEIEKIIWVRMVTTGNGTVLRSFRTTDHVSELEGCLSLGALAELEIPGEIIVGRIVAFGHHAIGEYEVTLEVSLGRTGSTSD